MTTSAVAVDGAFIPRARADVAVVSLDGETVIHDHGRIHVLDPTATLVWRGCDGAASVTEIAADLAAVFPAAPEIVRADVLRAVGRLAELGLLTDPTVDADPSARSAALEPVADPAGSCAGCAARTWALRTTFRVGPRLITVGTDSPAADAAMRAALGAHLAASTPGLDAEPPFLAIELPDRAPAGSPQLLALLHRGDSVAARSRRADRVLLALAAQLAAYGELPGLGLAAVHGLVVARGDRALIVAHPRDPVRFRRVLARHGVLVADQPFALVDPSRAEVVVGAPGLDVDLAPIAALAPESPGHDDSEPEPLPWGRYAVVSIGVPAPVHSSAALLALGPRYDDHLDHASSLVALVALFDAVPVTDAADPERIVELLANG